MPEIARKADPKLWNRIKQKWIRSNKGGPAGKNSARKMQMATKEYKARGGKYIGRKTNRNSMAKWTREDWGYIRPSGARTKKGRYLPRIVRDHLTPAEKARENRLKGSKRGRNVSYSRSVTKKMHRYKII